MLHDEEALLPTLTGRKARLEERWFSNGKKNNGVLLSYCLSSLSLILGNIAKWLQQFYTITGFGVFSEWSSQVIAPAPRKITIGNRPPWAPWNPVRTPVAPQEGLELTN